MTSKKPLPGGEYATAWQSVAAAAPRQRKPRGAFPNYTTQELIHDAAYADDETRARIEAEIARRLGH